MEGGARKAGPWECGSGDDGREVAGLALAGHTVGEVRLGGNTGVPWQSNGSGWASMREAITAKVTICRAMLGQCLGGMQGVLLQGSGGRPQGCGPAGL